MKYHKQLVNHDPANNMYGDCMRTAVACLLDREVLEVPHFYEGGVDTGAQDQWFDGQGLSIISLPFDSSVSEVLDMMGAVNPDTRYILCGRNPRGVNHVVITQGGEVIHDTSPLGGGVVAPCDDGFVWVEFIVSKGVHG